MFFLNFTDPTFINNPYPILKRLREEDPCHYSPLGFWFFTRFKDVYNLLHDDRFTHDHKNRMLKNHGEKAFEHDSIRYLSNSILLQNPPMHTQLRKIMAGFFMPSYISSQREKLQGYIQEAMEPLLKKRSMDFVIDLTQPVLGHVICDILGIPLEERAPFLGKTCLSARTLDPAAVPPDTRKILDQEVANVYPYFQMLFARKREKNAQPPTDLISHMVQVQKNYPEITETALIDNCLFIFAAGQEVTKCLMGNALIDFQQHPDQWQYLVNNPQVIDDSFDEILRYSTSLQMTHRLATQDVMYEGHLIKQGTPIILSLAGANRDPDANENPETLDLQRTKVKHLAFGRGIHHCIGAHLGSAEIKAIFKYLIENIPQLKISDQTLTWQPTITIRGLSHLMLEW